MNEGSDGCIVNEGVWVFHHGKSGICQVHDARRRDRGTCGYELAHEEGIVVGVGLDHGGID